MPFSFNLSQRQQLQTAYAAAQQAAASGVQGAYAAAYRLIFDMITDKPDANNPDTFTPKEGVDPASWVFLEGVPDVNLGSARSGGESDYSKFIRIYSKIQYKLRFGENALTEAQLDTRVQAASDGIAENILRDILNFPPRDGSTPDPRFANPNYELPIVSRIAQHDAQAAATHLFTQEQIGGWAGNPLFIALGYDGAYRRNILHEGTDNTGTYDALSVVHAMEVARGELGVFSSGRLLFDVFTHVIPRARSLNNFLSGVQGAGIGIGLTLEAAGINAALFQAAYGDNILGYTILSNHIHLGTQGNDVDILSLPIDDPVGDDIVHAGDGNDGITASRGDDIYDGGNGVDTVSFLTSDDVTIDLARNTAEVEVPGFNDRHRIFNVENIVTGSGDDRLAGNSGNNIFNGGTGSNGYYFAGAWGHDRVIDGSGGNSFLFINGMRLGGLANRISNPQAMGLPAESFVLYRPADNSVWAVMRMGVEVVARRRQGSAAGSAGNQPPRVFEFDDDGAEVPPALSRRQAAASGPVNASIAELGDDGSSVTLVGYRNGGFEINVGDSAESKEHRQLSPTMTSADLDCPLDGSLECEFTGTGRNDVIRLSSASIGEVYLEGRAGDDVVVVDESFNSPRMQFFMDEGDDIVDIGPLSAPVTAAFLTGGVGADRFILHGALSGGSIRYTFRDYNPIDGDVVDISAFEHIWNRSALQRLAAANGDILLADNVIMRGLSITSQTNLVFARQPSSELHLVPDSEGTVTNAPGDSVLYGSVGVNNFVVTPHEGSSVSILGMNERENDQIDLSAYDDWISSFADLEIDDFGTLTRRQGRDRDIYPNRHDARRDPEGDGQVWSRRQLFSNDSFGNCSVFDMNCTYNNQTQIPLQRIFLPGNGTNNTNMSVDVLNAALLTASSFIGNANVTALLPVAPVQPENPDDEAGKIAGGVVGGVLGVAFLAFCCWGGVKLYNRFRRPQAAEAAENEPYNHPPPHEGQEPRIYGGADVPDAVAAAAEQPGTVHHHRPPPNIDPANTPAAAQASWQHRTQQRAMQQVM